MDVTLVLTHRCNLACHYCYAGEHFRQEMDDATLARAVDLLFADRADVAQLSFFGGEPFLAFDTMRRAVALAQAHAAALGRRLLLQCTTNGSLLGAEQVEFVARTGMRVTVSLDGVQEAHDLNRPRAGGGSSFAPVHRGLRALIDAGARPDVMMVVTPATAPFVFRSVRWLWDEGVATVRANLSLRAPWDLPARAALRDELTAVGREQLARLLRRATVSFQPFEAGLRDAASGGARALDAAAVGTSAVRCGTARSPLRGQVVVGTGGHLYPCSPMVGEDRDAGPEAAMRIGHLADGAAALVARVVRDGAGCGDGRACACAAYLETGDRASGGANGLWFGRLCAELGAAVGVALAEARRRVAEEDTRERTLPPTPAPTRRNLLRGLLVGGGVALAGGAAASFLFGRTSGDLAPPPPDHVTAGGAGTPPQVDVDGDLDAPDFDDDPPADVAPAVPNDPDEPMVRGEVAAPPKAPPKPPPPPPKPPDDDDKVEIRGKVAMPPPPAPHVAHRGAMARPPFKTAK
ncbi:MAG TPA: radical SAM protein [Myxococcota bacterium]|jgi:uncharacterized protein|nr:radical SAM protein [Myxococcota bacterium]